MTKKFRPYHLNQLLLLPPDMREWLHEGHLAFFVLDIVATLDLSDIYKEYEQGDGRGQPPYDPQMIVALLVYAYCTGKPSSRKIAQATSDEVAYRVISGDQHPDHTVICDFRKRHMRSLAGLFVQVLKLCEAAGLVKLGHVALDGTKMKANASKHKAMSYDRMTEAEKKLEAEVTLLLMTAAEVDAAENTKYGKDKRGDELPDELSRRESRLAKIREAKAALEAEAKERAEHEVKVVEEKQKVRDEKEKETGHKSGGRLKAAPDPDLAKPDPKAQKNFTDSESRIMIDGTSKSFEQAYNAQAAVDSENQIIVAADVTQETNDKKQLIPMIVKVKENTGRMPSKVSADAGYFSESNITDSKMAGVDLYIPPDKQKHSKQARFLKNTRNSDAEVLIPPPSDAKVIDKMRHKLKTDEGHEVYRMRKQIVEPVFGQTKEIRGFRRFSFRGLQKVTEEWNFICLTHNLLKLFRYGVVLQTL